MCLCWWKGSQRKIKKRKEKKKERQNRYQELGHLSQIYSGSKRIRITKVKSRGLTALSEFAAGGPSREQKSTVLREWGPEAWIPRQTDLICGTLDKLTFQVSFPSCKVCMITVSTLQTLDCKTMAQEVTEDICFANCGIFPVPGSCVIYNWWLILTGFWIGSG